MKPILFNTEMVRAILDGCKTVTRRVVKLVSMGMTYEDGSPARNPPYRPGDILYVRETWAAWSRTMGTPPALYYKADGNAPDGIKWRPSIHMPKEAARLFLRVKDVRVERLHDITEDGAKQEGIQYTDFGTYLPNWKMSIDGGKTFHSSKKEIHHPGYHVGQADTPEKCYQTAKGAFRALWNSTIKPADRAIYGWEANPWVWVIEFERITREEAENG